LAVIVWFAASSLSPDKAVIRGDCPYKHVRRLSGSGLVRFSIAIRLNIARRLLRP
jgi:hypothetical protein